MIRPPILAYLSILLFLAGCSGSPGRSENNKITPPLQSKDSSPVAAPLLPAPTLVIPAKARQFVVDTKASEAIILVRTHGRLAGKVADDHVIRIHPIQGKMALLQSLNGSTFQLQIAVNQLMVDTERLRKRFGHQAIPPGQAARIRVTMLGPRVLDAGRFPLIQVAGKIHAKSPEIVSADVNINLHGRNKTYLGVPITFKQAKGRVVVSGSMSLNQSDFGIEPLSLLAGSLKVADEMEIHFHFIGRRK